MPGYPPESSWNDPPTDAQVRSIIKAGGILHIDITERDIPPTRWQARDLQRDLWERVRNKGKKISEEVNMNLMGSCYSCGYPIGAAYGGQEISCPMCGTENKAISGRIGGVGSTLLIFGIGLAIGIFAGPAIIASTEAGSQWLAKKARERIK